ncbi:MAG: family 78 glycoside hydrolase catalytic domain [Coriobacteriales bacterium]|jgi:alpha-L-rhamnosidase
MKKAEWIWLDKKAESDEYAAFDDGFYWDGKTRLKLKISVAGDYNAYINGRFVSFGQYADFAHYKIYDETEITPFLEKGENKLFVVGWYVGRSFSTCKDFGAGLSYEVEDEDGEILCFSDEGTRSAYANGYVSHVNKVITGQLGFSYVYDTRSALYEWKGAKRAEGFGKNLVKRPNAKLQLGEFVSAALIDKEKKLYDLGRESCGFLEIKFKAEAGERVAVAFGEHIADGGVRAFIEGRDFTAELIGNGKYTAFTGAFRRFGCRYLQVFGEAEIEYIGLREVFYPLTVRPYKIENERRRKIYETALRTLELCLHEHYEDCPWREQSMYIMDTRSQMLCGYYAFDNPECALSAIRLMAAGQKENGLFELCFPAEVPITIPSFSLAFTTVVLEYTQFAKDCALAKEMLPVIEKMLGFFLSRLDGDGLFKTVSEEGIWHFYEWAGALDGAFFELDGSKKYRNEYDSLINAFLSIALDNTAKLFSVTGEYDKAIYYQDIRIKLNKSLKEKFYSPETGLFRTYSDREEYSELSNALCVLAEACSDEEAKAIAEKLAVGYDGWVRNTLSMSIFRYDALLKTDREKYVPAILKDIDETYGYMLDNGATSFWETIKGEADFHNAGSLCHGWSALPVYYYRIFGLCGEREKPVGEAFSVRDIPSRTAYAAAVSAYVNDREEGCRADREKILSLPERERRRRLEQMLGRPLGEKWLDTRLISKETLLTDSRYRAVRYTFLLDEKIPFSGILYENAEKISEREKLVIALHGGGGSSEIVGDLFMPSSNYNRMVLRVLKPSTKVFAPQLLLWNSAVYGSGYDREWLNRRLIQQGGSITAFEVQCLKKMLDWWENDPATDTQRLGVIGLSYGGMYALHFGALDTRIYATYSSCWFSDRKKHNWCDWTYFNAERTFFDTETASLVFPRRLYIEVADEDEAFPASDGRQERLRLEAYAAKTGNADKLTFKEFKGKHELDLDSDALETFVKDVKGE